MYKVCATTGLWATCARVAIGPSASHGGQRSYNIQIAETSVETMKSGTAVTVCAFHTVFFH